ncbi:hypothetical protein JHK85_011022 [Glycine max]|nr:hypothetical protein JHK85_011022 [Glycine max]KHN30964.1 hypothetical protein glysoja_017501 [Glycine soja]
MGMRWREYFLPKSKSIPFILLSLCFQQTSTTTHFAVSNYYLTPDVRPEIEEGRVENFGGKRDGADAF